MDNKSRYKWIEDEMTIDIMTIDIKLNKEDLMKQNEMNNDTLMPLMYNKIKFNATLLNSNDVIEHLPVLNIIQC